MNETFVKLKRNFRNLTAPPHLETGLHDFRKQNLSIYLLRSTKCFKSIEEFMSLPTCQTLRIYEPKVKHLYCEQSNQQLKHGRHCLYILQLFLCRNINVLLKDLQYLIFKTIFIFSQPDLQ